MGNVFAKAKEVAPKAKKKAGKREKQEIEIAGLGTFAAINALEKAIAGIKATLESDVKRQVRDAFYAEGTKVERRPENFDGTDGDARASCQFKKRSSRSVLTPEEVVLLAANGVAFSTDTVVEDTFVINPAYASDSKLLERVGKAIGKVANVPDDFIQHQPGVAKKVVSNQSMEDVFKGDIDPIVRRELMEVVSSVALRTSLGADQDLKDAAAMLQEILED